MAFFGMDGTQVRGVPDKFPCEEADCLLCEMHLDAQAHCLFHQLRAEDVVFIKKFSPQTGLVVMAAGVVEPGSFIERETGDCVHVKWSWCGEKHTVAPEDTDGTRGNPVYEEFDLGIQRQIIELLPDSGHDPYRWVIEASPRQIWAGPLG